MLPKPPATAARQRLPATIAVRAPGTTAGGPWPEPSGEPSACLTPLPCIRG
ncbi:hypothetical protein GN316_17270 [Xylophilus sp. Kf1]|nr:hypothetical protein [Xylophilus sp. Kf1]